MIPYFSYLLFFFVTYSLFQLFHKISLNDLLEKAFKTLFIGGREIGGVFGVFWFITCLLFTTILFSIIEYKLRDIQNQIIIIIALYILAHIESMVIIPNYTIMIPWNFDVAMFALSFFALGFYLKKYPEKISEIRIFKNFWFWVFFIAIAIILIICDKLNFMTFNFDMKHVNYTNPILDFFIPVLFSIIIIRIMISIDHYNPPQIFNNILQLVGKDSLSIIYLHLLVYIIIIQIIQYNCGLIFLTFLGIVIPITIHEYLLERNSILKKLFISK